MSSESITEILQEKIDKISAREWFNDDCKPEFKLSILYDTEQNQFIVLSIDHLGHSFSKIIFPKKENLYGYDSVLSDMKDLYNQTM